MCFFSWFSFVMPVSPCLAFILHSQLHFEDMSPCVDDVYIHISLHLIYDICHWSWLSTAKSLLVMRALSTPLYISPSSLSWPSWPSFHHLEPSIWYPLLCHWIGPSLLVTFLLTALLLFLGSAYKFKTSMSSTPLAVWETHCWFNLVWTV